jgi:hypothetical protein
VGDDLSPVLRCSTAQRFCGIALMRQPRAGYRPLDARKKGSSLSAVFEAFLTLYGLFVFVVELSRQLGLQLGFIGEALTMGQPALYAVILIWHRCDCLALCVSTARPLKI